MLDVECGFTGAYRQQSRILFPTAAPQAALASKINTYLSGPMLWGMIAGSHVNIWPMTIGTFLLAIVLAGGLIHGLYATSRKVKTTV